MILDQQLRTHSGGNIGFSEINNVNLDAVGIILSNTLQAMTPVMKVVLLELF